MTDIDYNALFGLDAGENEPETAEPAASQEGAEEDAQEESDVQEPAETQEDTAADAQEAGENKPEVAEPAKAQGKEQNARYAAARRKAEAERDAAVQKARDEADGLLKDVLAASGLTDPFTGKAVTTREEFEQYRKSQANEKRRSIQRKVGMTDAEFDGFIEGLPEVQAARQAQAAAEKAAQETRQAQAQARIDAEIAEIGKLNPEVKGVGDLPKLPEYGEIYAMVQRGYTLLDAYKLVNLDALTSRAREAGKQQARNAADGKTHMGKTKSRGAGDVELTQEELAQFRIFNPAATEDEVRGWLRKHKK